MPIRRRTEYAARDPKRGMTTGEILDALADSPDNTAPRVVAGWRGNIKRLIIETSQTEATPTEHTD